MTTNIIPLRRTRSSDAHQQIQKAGKRKRRTLLPFSEAFVEGIYSVVTL